MKGFGEHFSVLTDFIDFLLPVLINNLKGGSDIQIYGKCVYEYEWVSSKIIFVQIVFLRIVCNLNSWTLIIFRMMQFFKRKLGTLCKKKFLSVLLGFQKSVICSYWHDWPLRYYWVSYPLLQKLSSLHLAFELVGKCC